MSDFEQGFESGNEWATSVEDDHYNTLLELWETQGDRIKSGQGTKDDLPLCVRDYVLAETTASGIKDLPQFISGWIQSVIEVRSLI